LTAVPKIRQAIDPPGTFPAEGNKEKGGGLQYRGGQIFHTAVENMFTSKRIPLESNPGY